MNDAAKDEVVRTHYTHPHNFLPGQQNKKSRGFFKKYLLWPLMAIVLIGIAGVAFIKFNTAAAAELTDKYLRPIFGESRVVFFEKLFFNASDSASKAVYNFATPSSPKFIPSAPDLTASAGMNLNPILANPAFTALPGEGIWKAIPLTIFPDKEAMAYTFVRPDSTRSFAIVSLVKIDTSMLTIGSVAGTVEPGGKVGKYGTGRVPKAIVQSGGLIAAFDGGFQYSDGQYGMIVGKNTYLPLKNDLGTIVGYADGSVKILDYTGQDLGSNTTFIRQNGPMLIQDGNIVVTDAESQKTWGRVVGADMFTWRSGIGVTQDGDLVFAAGNNLSPQTLAQALELAGAINAIQLDINPHWVRFNIFNSTGAGTYNSVPLNKDMTDGSKEYLNGYQKDFFYIYKK